MGGLRIVIFGATGMIGQGALRECVRDSGVDSVLAVVRTPLPDGMPKLTQVEHRDFTDFSSVTNEFADSDGCFYCLGVSSVGMSEADYTRVTYDYGTAANAAFQQASPNGRFLFVSGVGSDADSSTMWRKVKGRSENAILEANPNGFVFRPGAVMPRDGIRSRTGWVNGFYTVTAPLRPLLLRALPGQVNHTRRIGRAMLAVTRDGYSQRILSARDINIVAS